MSQRMSTSRCVAGHTVTPFADGQIGTGKTHTVVVGGGVLSVKYE
jgi:hypothetical protein